MKLDTKHKTREKETENQTGPKYQNNKLKKKKNRVDKCENARSHNGASMWIVVAKE